MRTTALCCLISLSLLALNTTGAHAQTTSPGVIQLGGAINAANTTASGSGTLTDNSNNLATTLDQGDGVQVGNTGQTSSNFPGISDNPSLTTGSTPISGTGTTVPTATTTTTNGAIFDNLTNTTTTGVTNTTIAPVTGATNGTGVATTTGGQIVSNGGDISTSTGGTAAAGTTTSGATATTIAPTITPAQFDASSTGAATPAVGTAPTVPATGTTVTPLGTGAAGAASTSSAECLAVQDCVDNSLPIQTQACAAASTGCAGIQQESTSISAGALALRSIQQRGCNRTFTTSSACLRCFNRAARQLRFSQDQALFFGLFRNAAALVRQQAAETCGALP